MLWSGLSGRPVSDELLPGYQIDILCLPCLQVLRQQMEVVQNQMQRLQAHREQEGLSASRAAPAAQNTPSSSQAAGACSSQAASSSAAHPAAASSGAPAAARSRPHQPAGTAEGANPAEDICQRRLHHFHTGE